MKISTLSRWALLVIAAVGCSSAGTESGNPSRGCNTRCACSPVLTIHATDSVSGMPIGQSITVDGQSFECDAAGACVVSGAVIDSAGTHDLTVSAPGYAETTFTVVARQVGGDCCECVTLTDVDVALQPLP